MQNIFLRYVRKQKGYIATAFEQETGIRVGDLSKYENRKTTPRDDKIHIMAELFQIDPNLLSLSFGLLPREIRKNVESFPLYYFEKFKEIWDNGPKAKEMKDYEIEFINKEALEKFFAKEMPNDPKK